MTAPKVTPKDKVKAFQEAMSYLSYGHLPKSEIEKLLERIEATSGDTK